MPRFPLLFKARKAASALQTLRQPERFLAGVFALLLLGGLIWGVALFLRATTETRPARGGVVRTGVVGQPRFVLPILATTNDADADLSRLVYSGLLKATESNRLAPDLAEDIEVSEDGKTYTARLREGVRWHDGEPLTAEDVLLTVRLIQDPATKSPLAPAFQGVSVSKEDDRRVRFTLQEPYAPFLFTLTVGILPKHVWGDIPPNGLALSEHALRPIGTGPFAFEKLKRAEFSGEIHEYRLARNERYYGPPPLLDAMLFRFFLTTDDLLRALRREDIDGASFLPPSLVRDAERTRSIRVERLRLPQYFAVFFHQAKSVPLGDPAVRRALTAAVDRDALIREALFGEGERAEAPIPEGTVGYAPDLAFIPFDPERAKQNLEEAGWKDLDGNGIREKDGVPLRFSLATTDWPEYVATANLLAAQWRVVGADVAVAPSAVGTMQADVLRPRKYEALLYGEVLGGDPDPYSFWHSTQTRDPGLNLALFKDRATDQLLEEARKTTDAETRGATYRKFQERLVEEVPALFLYSPTYAYAVPRKLRGTFPSHAPHPSDRFSAIGTWYLKTKRERKHPP